MRSSRWCVVADIRHNVELITVKKAQDMLKKMNVNRPLSRSRIDQYARDMLNESYVFTGEAIKVDVNGFLIDGQHRLHAIIRTGVPQKMLVVRGLPPESQDYMDIGRMRNVGEILHFKGETNGPLIGAIARNIFRIEHGMMAGGTVISVPEVLSVVEAHPEIKRCAEIAMRGKRDSATPIAPSTQGTAHWMIAQVNGWGDADIFVHRVQTCANEKLGSPVLALQRRCNEIRRSNQRVGHRDYLAMMIKTWNLDATGKTANRISTTSRNGVYVLPKVIRLRMSLIDSMDERDNESAEYEQDEAASS